MKRLLILLLALLVSKVDAATAVPIKVAISPINVSVIADRGAGSDSCPAPCGVFFDATGSMSPQVTSNPLLDMQVSWSFGDPAGGATWSTGSGAGSNSKNAATGQIVYHVFETPGTYTVTATFNDGTNTATGLASVTVADPEVVYAGDVTVCVNNTGDNDFSACPQASATHYNASDAGQTALALLTGSVKRILFKKGGTWTFGSSGPSFAISGPCYIGAYGSGDAPSFVATGNQNMVNLGTSTKCVVDGISFDGANQAQSRGVVGGSSQNLVIRISTTGTEQGVGWATSGANSGAIVSSSFSSGSTGAGGSVYGVFATQTTSRFAFLGNSADIGNTAPRDHDFRASYLNKAIISNNTVTSARQTAFKIHAPTYSSANPDGSYTQSIYFSDNKIIGAGATGASTDIYLEAQNSTSDERLRNIVVERNWFLPTTITQQPMSIAANNVVVRNNVLGNSTDTSFRLAFLSRIAAVPVSTDGVAFYNNSVYGSTNLGAGLVRICTSSCTSDVVNVALKNNLVYAPNATKNAAGVGAAPSLYVDNSSGTGFAASNNSSDGDIKSTNPLFTSVSPFTPANAKPTAGSYAIGGGTAVPVWSDFFGVAQPNPRTIGAVNP